jgi:hypothetical protein
MNYFNSLFKNQMDMSPLQVVVVGLYHATPTVKGYETVYKLQSSKSSDDTSTEE